MGRVGRLVVFGLFACGLSLHAQTPSDPKPSELQQVKAENIRLKAQLVEALKTQSDLTVGIGGCQAQLGPLQQAQNQRAIASEETALRTAFETEHPGYTWDPKTDVVTKKPDQPTPDPKKAGGR